jgi:hypothetical protein
VRSLPPVMTTTLIFASGNIGGESYGRISLMDDEVTVVTRTEAAAGDRHRASTRSAFS